MNLILVSLLSGCTSFTASNSVEAFLDILAGPGGVTLLAFEVEQTCACISCHLCFNALATKTTHVLFHILFIETIDHGSLMATLKEDISFRANITIDIHLRFDIVE